MRTSSELDSFSSQLNDAGFDLTAPLDVAWYNRRIAGHPVLRPVEPFGPSSLAMLVGNTRALWPRFLAALEGDLGGVADPLDAYTERVLAAAVKDLPFRSDVFLSHHGASRLVGMAHAAEAAGVATTGPARLLVHPVHGPWMALRALVVFDQPAEGLQQPSAPALCEGCPAPCLPAFQAALAHGTPRDSAGIAAQADAWIAVRGACPVGRASRYDDDQVAYHYTKDRSRLTRRRPT